MKFSFRFSIRTLLYATIILSFSALNVALVKMSFLMYPVKRGTPEEFWTAMYQLNFGGPTYIGGVYPPPGDECIYYRQGLHGQILFSVPIVDAERLLPSVRPRALKDFAFLSKDERDLLESDGHVQDLLSARIAAKGTDVANHSEESVEYQAQEQSAFVERWGRIQRFWANILFEALYLNLWLAVLWMPFLLKRNAHIRRAVFAGLSLPLLFAPYFLGYCPWSFSSAGPSGGALYPMMLLPFYGWPWKWNAFDYWLLEHLASPLEPLSQETGGMMSVSGLGGVSPTSAIVLGVVVGVAAYLASRIIALRCGPSTSAQVSKDPAEHSL